MNVPSTVIYWRFIVSLSTSGVNFPKKNGDSRQLRRLFFRFSDQSTVTPANATPSPRDAPPQFTAHSMYYSPPRGAKPVIKCHSSRGDRMKMETASGLTALTCAVPSFPMFRIMTSNHSGENDAFDSAVASLHEIETETKRSWVADSRTIVSLPI